MLAIDPTGYIRSLRLPRSRTRRRTTTTRHLRCSKTTRSTSQPISYKRASPPYQVPVRCYAAQEPEHEVGDHRPGICQGDDC